MAAQVSLPKDRVTFLGVHTRQPYNDIRAEMFPTG